MPSRYWVGNSGSWSDNTNHWAATSGGSPGASTPDYTYDVFFDANSFSLSNQTVTLDNSYYVKSMDWTGATGNPTFYSSNAAYQFRLYDGSLTLVSGMTWNLAGSILFSTLSLGSGPTIGITSYGVNVGCSYMIFSNGGPSGGGVFNINDDLTTTGRMLLSSGVTLNSNDHNISAGPGFECTSPSLTTVWNLGSGTWQFNSSTNGGSTYILNLSGGSLSVNPSSGTIKAVNTGTTTMRFSSTFALNNLWITGNGNNIFEFRDSFTCNDFKCDGAPCTISVFSPKVITVTTFTVSGTSGNLITVKSGSSGNKWTLSKSTGTVNCDWLSMQDSEATGGATFNATNSIDVSGNSGWNISATPITMPLIGEDIGVSEDISFFIPFMGVSVSDPIVVSENISCFPTQLYLSINDTVSVSESYSGEPVYVLRLSENVTVTEALVYDPDLVYVTEYISLTIIKNEVVCDESIGISEGVSMFIPELFISIFDAVTISEETSGQIFVFIKNVNELIIVSEEISLSLVDSAVDFESITVSEYINMETALNIGCNDSITVSENMSGELSMTGRLFPNVPRGKTYSSQGLSDGGLIHDFH